MTQATARTALYNVVNGVSNKGVCYDRCRLSTTWDTFLSLFKTIVSGADQIRGWWIEWRGAPTEELTFEPFGGGSSLRAHSFRVFGVMGLDDSEATEKTFSALAEAIANAINTDSALHDESSFYDCSPASIDVVEPRVFTGVLCHYAEINVTIREII